jgi:hypothetical protein
METNILNATEYRNVSLSLLNESKTNPRRIFEKRRSQGTGALIFLLPMRDDPHDNRRSVISRPHNGKG